MSEDFERRRSELDQARWQGEVDSTLRELTRRATETQQELGNVRVEMAHVREELATVKSRVAVFSAVGGLLGAGAVSIAVKVTSGLIIPMWQEAYRWLF